MGDIKSPDDADLHWPVARGELDDLETLELGRDAAGRLTWQNMPPPEGDAYRAWLPRRGKSTPPAGRLDQVDDTSADDPIALFATEATRSATEDAAQPLGEPAAPALEERASAEPPSEHRDVRDRALAAAGDDPDRRTTPQAEREHGNQHGARGESDVLAPAASTPVPRFSPKPWSTAVAAPLRLSLAVKPVEGRRPMRISLLPRTPQARTTVERLALLGTGALLGVIASMAVGAAWRPDRAASAAAAAERPSPSPPAPASAPAAAPAVPDAQPATVDDAAARPAATEIAPVAASTPVQGAATVAPSRQGTSPARPAAPTTGSTATATRLAASPAPIATPPEVLATVGRYAAAYSRMDATAMQALWPTADRQALVTTFTARREQRLTLSGCRGTMQGDTATVLCRGTLRYRPRVGNHDTRTVEGTWRFSMLQRVDDWVLENVETP